MNLKIAIGAVIVLLVIGGAYFFSVKQADAPIASGQPAGEAVPGKTDLEMESVPAEEAPGLLNFLTTRGAAKCVITSKDGAYTVMTDGKRVRIDGIAMPSKDSAGGTAPGTMINDGRYAYLWSGTEGTKFDLEALKSITQSFERPEGAGIPEADPKDWKEWAESLEASGAQYDCDAATVSESDFTLPATVQFTDLSELMKQMPKDMKAVMPNQGAAPDMSQLKLPAGMPVQQ